MQITHCQATQQKPHSTYSQRHHFGGFGALLGLSFSPPQHRDNASHHTGYCVILLLSQLVERFAHAQKSFCLMQEIVPITSSSKLNPLKTPLVVVLNQCREDPLQSRKGYYCQSKGCLENADGVSGEALDVTQGDSSAMFCWRFGWAFWNSSEATRGSWCALLSPPRKPFGRHYLAGFSSQKEKKAAFSFLQRDLPHPRSGANIWRGCSSLVDFPVCVNDSPQQGPGRWLGLPAVSSWTAHGVAVGRMPHAAL